MNQNQLRWQTFQLFKKANSNSGAFYVGGQGTYEAVFLTFGSTYTAELTTVVPVGGSGTLPTENFEEATMILYWEKQKTTFARIGSFTHCSDKILSPEIWPVYVSVREWFLLLKLEIIRFSVVSNIH